ncbi:uncharacterized protein METZ01_LOCUS504154, partial [marine metagenome]
MESSESMAHMVEVLRTAKNENRKPHMQLPLPQTWHHRRTTQKLEGAWMMEFIEFLNRRWRFIWPFKGMVCWEMQIGFIVIQYAFDDWWHD